MANNQLKYFGLHILQRMSIDRLNKLKLGGGAGCGTWREFVFKIQTSLFIRNSDISFNTTDFGF